MNEDLNELLSWLQTQITTQHDAASPIGATYQMGFRAGCVMAAVRVRMLIAKHGSCSECGGKLDEDGDGTRCHLCCEYVSPEEQRRQDAMDRGDYERDREKDERAERRRQ